MKGHRVIDGPHTHHDVKSEVVEKLRQAQLKVSIFHEITIII